MFAFRARRRAPSALLLAFALGRRAATVRCGRLAVLALALFWLLAGLAGGALALLWLATAHDFAARNENLLLLNPLALPLLAALPALWHERRVSTGLRRLAMLVAGLALLAPLSKGLPMFPQPNLHWIALFLPLHLAAARALRRSGERP
ncbi:MAG: hypothetical protein RML12_05510 [Xanthomonadales bacterium]|nr:hypothetical protein [Xanthomonadales bacterium]